MMGALTLELVHERAQHPLFERLTALGLPGNKTEHYRHFAIKPLLAHNYTLHTVAEHTPKTGQRLVIENGRVIEIPANCAVSHTGSFTADTDHFDALYFLSHLLAPTVISVDITADTVVELRHTVTLPETLQPYRISVNVAPGKQAEVHENFRTAQSRSSLLLYGIDARVEADAALHWVRNESSTETETALVGSHRFDVCEGAALTLRTFDCGTAQALHLYKIDLDERSRCDAGHLLMASGNARRGNITRINHNGPYTECVQDARSILRDHATGIFDGLLRINAGARYADARQNSRAVLLDTNAHMYAKPQMEIYTDELQASHGATIGQLDEEALFYLRSRGIADAEARKMLVLAFADGLIDSVSDTFLRERIHADFERAYSEKDQS